ncbi:MAG: hypothetical protein M0R47_15880 [Methylobacter sp.]|uniref:phage tail fiber protein n=1 Tax=Methylobacter sp. TaxID=2051955 RepID=UPI0025D24665|nr:hypothetical protein [Methylobacter sp.]MCK9622000.1 hypothetical protein [Methylobacter sp.]
MKKITRYLLLPLLFAASFSASALGLSDYAENKVADVLFRNTAFSESSPASYYVFLSSTACSDSATGTELTGGSYARVGVTRATASWKGTHGTTTGASSGTNATISNAAAVTFPTATADWATASHWGIIDSASGAGNIIICAALTANRTITAGATASFAIDALTIQIDSN